MELGTQNHENLGWELLTQNEIEILKKTMPPDEPEVVDELINAMQILGNKGNIRLDKKVWVMLSIVKAIVFLMQYTERNDAAVINISSEEERFILRNLTKFAIFLIKSLSLNEVFELIKASTAIIWKLLLEQAAVSGQIPNITESASSSSSSGVDP
ncbi:hypothetical protein CARUB_v10027293mg [Capsella rubella]|uniref:Uncharacterized protein n=1 Tax=Capsella rubella TaxID=81985 RepID=R0GSI9_9BRAS|nr:hypothetical protein CARUB_v10027293mg [Capsella rubella]